MLELELTQPLVDGLGVLTRERGTSLRWLLHTLTNKPTHTHTHTLTFPSKSCSGLTNPLWGVPLTCRVDPPRKQTQLFNHGGRQALSHLTATDHKSDLLAVTGAFIWVMLNTTSCWISLLCGAVSLPDVKTHWARSRIIFLSLVTLYHSGLRLPSRLLSRCFSFARGVS